MSTHRERSASAREHFAYETLGREAAGVLAGAAALFLALSLATYRPSDPAFNAVAPRGPVNWGGVVGAYAADGLLQFLGVIAYLLPMALAVAAWRGLRGERLGLDWLRAAGLAALLLGASALAGLVAGQGAPAVAAGGVVGHAVADGIRVAFGRVGAYVVLVPAVLVAAMLAAGRPASPAARRLLALAASCGRAAARSPARLAARVGGWRAARAARRRALTPVVRTPAAPIQVPADAIEVLPARHGQRKGAGSPAAAGPAGREPEDDATDVTGAAPAPGGKAQGGPIRVVEPAAGQSRGLRARGKRPSEDDDAAGRLSFEHGTPAGPGAFVLPPLAFLDAPPGGARASLPRDELLGNARLLERKLAEFGVDGRVTEVHPGPVITMYEYEPAPGVKVNRIVTLADDLAMALKALSVRIVAPLPHRAAVGIEVPNAVREHVALREILSAGPFQKSASPLTFGLGKDIAGAPIAVDLARMPHLLVAGATGSGKSVSVNAMIVSVLYKATPEQVRLLMVDPKMLELNVYDGIPHLLLPVVTEAKKAAQALRWGVMEMERRYRLLADAGVRNIEQYNRNLEEAQARGLPFPPPRPGAEADAPEAGPEEARRLPYIMIVVDELADLMMVIGREVEESIARLAQKARAAGIHLLLATQRPSVDVITGLIKANFPARIAFQVASRVDSRTILDANGAEHLLGQGDMLLLPPGSSKLQRIHGAYVSEIEIKRIVDFLKAQAEPEYDESILEGADDDGLAELDEAEIDPKYDEAIQVVCEARMASTSLIQRRLRIGYNRAARMIERMEREGIVGPGDGARPREVLPGRIGRAGPDRT